MEHIYRFRPAKALLDGEGGFNELEKQEIFFSPLDKLNDPMEGFKDIFWQGDEVIWRNLLRHYIFCLESVCLTFYTSPGEVIIKDSDLIVKQNPEDILTPEGAKVLDEIYTLFFSHNIAAQYPSLLSKRVSRVGREELTHHLTSLHAHALNSILTVYEKYNIIPARTGDNALQRASSAIMGAVLFDKINSREKNLPAPDNITEQLFRKATSDLIYNSLIYKLNNMGFVSDANRKFILSEFTQKYIKGLEELVHPPYYLACFSKNYTSPALWSYYGDHHKGICLKFKVNTYEGIPGLKLRGVVGLSGSSAQQGIIYGETNHSFSKVNYQGNFPEINFFNALGSIPHPVADKSWYCSEGKTSICADGIHNNIEQWRREYWQEFNRTATVKLKDWAHEEEYRIILHQGHIQAPDINKLTYSFQDLEGIIFGLNTPEQEKLAIRAVLKTEVFIMSDFRISQKCIRLKRNFA